MPLAETAVLTYSAGDLGDFGADLVLAVHIFDHVVGEETHSEVVVTADNAGEDRDARHQEEEILDDFLSVHCHFCLVQAAAILYIQLFKL